MLPLLGFETGGNAVHFSQRLIREIYDASFHFWAQNRGNAARFFFFQTKVIMETFDVSTFGFKTGRNAVLSFSKTTRETL